MNIRSPILSKMEQEFDALRLGIIQERIILGVGIAGIVILSWGVAEFLYLYLT